MPTIVYQTNSKGVKYAYESTSYWDKEKKKTRTRRRYIGRVDPETGIIIPAKSRNNDLNKTENTGKFPPECSTCDLSDEIRIRDEEIKSLKEQLETLKTTHETALNKLRQIADISASALNCED